MFCLTAKGEHYLHLFTFLLKQKNFSIMMHISKQHMLEHIGHYQNEFLWSWILIQLLFWEALKFIKSAFAVYIKMIIMFILYCNVSAIQRLLYNKLAYFILTYGNKVCSSIWIWPNYRRNNYAYIWIIHGLVSLMQKNILDKPIDMYWL